jgi:hypothetical protein
MERPPPDWQRIVRSVERLGPQRLAALQRIIREEARALLCFGAWQQTAAFYRLWEQIPTQWRTDRALRRDLVDWIAIWTRHTVETAALLSLQFAHKLSI